MDLIGHISLGLQALVSGPDVWIIPGALVTPLMTLLGFVLGMAVGATPGLAGPVAMAISLPLLISGFGVSSDALLPVVGCLIGIMKGATVGGAVPAILFNTPGTPDAFMTTLDGHPMARRGQGAKALRIAHAASVRGDTTSDLVLILCAPFLAVMVERLLDLPEKTALLILSLAFISAVIGGSAGKGLISMGLGLLAAAVGTGEDFYPRLSLDTEALSRGFPIGAAVLGVLILGEIFVSLEDMWRRTRRGLALRIGTDRGSQRLTARDRRALRPVIARSAAIGTAIGALPGVGSTLAATLGYASARRRHERGERTPPFGEGAQEGIAATEAANSAVSGANLIPVLSLGIPGNAAAVFLILAFEAIDGFVPGPTVFRLPADGVNPELVLVFGIFATMLLANAFNWTLGGLFMRSMGGLTRIPKHLLLPCVLLLTLTAIYVQYTRMEVIWFTLAFGVLGYVMRRLGISPLPFVIAFILAGTLEQTARAAFSATGADPLFLFSSLTSTLLMAAAVGVVVWVLHARR